MELFSVKPLCRMCGGFRPPRTSARLPSFRKLGVLRPKLNSGFELRPAFRGRRLCGRMTPLQTTSKSTISEVLWGMTVQELKKILRKYEAPSSGAKANLVARVITLAEDNETLLRELMPEGTFDREAFLAVPKPAPVPVTQSIANSNVSSPASLTDNMVLLDELSQRTVAELRDDLQALGLPSSGRKMDLVMRLAATKQDSRLEEKRKAGGKEGALAEKLQTLQGMTMSGLVAFLEDRGQTGVHNLTQAQLLEKCQREVQREFYQSGERISREDFEALLNRQVETRRAECYSVMEIRKRLRDLNESVEGNRVELAKRLEAAVERCHKITDAVTIRLDALAEEWFQNTVKNCEGGTLLDGLHGMEFDELETQLKRRSLKPVGNVEELRSTLRTALSVELGISSGALADLATSLIDKVYTLTEPAIRMLLDMDPRMKLSTTRRRECCDVIILRLAPRLMDIFDREIKIEEAAKQSIAELKDDPMRLERETAETESLDPSMTIAVVFGGGGESIGESLASLRCMLDQLQTAKYHAGETVENKPPKKSKESDSASSGLQVIPYLMKEDQRMYRLTAANAFALDEASIQNGVIPVGAALVGNLTDWVKEMEEVDLVFPLIYGPMATAGEFREAIDSLQAPCLGTSGEAAATATNKFRVFEILQEKGFPLLPIFPMTKSDLEEGEAWYQAFVRWCQQNGYDLATSKFVIKSANRGATTEESSPVEVADAIGEARRLLSEGVEDAVVLEEYVVTDRAAEFKCWVIDTQEGPIALLPTEIEYPPSELIRPLSSSKRHHTPAKMDLDKIQSIRMAATGVFKACGLRDFARIDGLVMMDNTPEARSVKILPPIPRPIPKGIYKEELEEEDTSPDFEAALDEVWAEHVAEVNEAIEEWETTEEDPLALEFKKWLFTKEPCEGIDPDNLPDPVPDFKEYRDRRPGPIVEDFSDVDAFLEQVNQEPDTPVDYEDLCTGSNYTVVVTDVNLSGSFQSSSLLFQQAACVGLSHASVLRHFVNLALVRADLEPLPSLPPEPKLWNPLCNYLYPKQKGADDQEDDDDDADYYDREYGMDGEPTDDTMSDDALSILSESFEEEEEEEEEAPSSEQDEAWEEAQQKDRAQQIWVLCGGDGPGQQISFHSGINAWLKLRRSNDLQVTPSVLIPEEYSSGKRDRLEGLLERRNRFLEEGVPEGVVDAYDDLTLEYIRNPKPMGCQLDWRMVMTLDPISALAPTLDEALEAAERRLLATNTAPHVRDTEMVGMLESEQICQNQLAFAGVEGVGGLWGGKLEPAPIARMMTLHFYALEAQSLRAIVHLAMHGDLAEDGTLQHFLEDYDILYTGSNETAAGLCLDKSQVSTRLDPEGSPGVSTTPNKISTVEELVGASSDIEACQTLFEETSSNLDNSQKLCIKPINGAIGSGVARLQCARDVQLYGQALKCRAPKLENEMLSGLHSSVSMVLSNPSKFLVEPYFPTGPYKWNGDALEIEGNSPWVELTIGLIGGLGAMRAFTPSLVMRSVDSPVDFDRKFTYGQDDVLTPVPSSIVPPEMVRTMQDKAQGVADRLGLAGVAQIDTFLHVETGEMVVIEVNTSPNLAPSSPILQQAALEKTPVYPDEFFREMVIVAATPFSVEESFEEEEETEVYSEFDQELDFV